jgi:hypothetical protein
VHSRDIGFVVAIRIAAAALCVFAPVAAKAQQAPTPTQQSTGNATAAGNNGEDFTRPENLFQLRYIYQTAPGSGAVPGTTRTVTSDTVVLRSDLKFDIGPQWTLALRGDLPLAAKDPLTADDPNANYLYGLGDADVQAALIRTINDRWAAGGGLRIVAPTGTGDLTAGKWQALPIVGARYMLPELSPGSFFTGIVRYDVSFAGNPTARNISNLQFDPLLNIALPDRWFVTLYPSADIRINYGAPVTGQTGRLFLPADVSVGRNVTRDIVLSLEVSVPIVNQYPVYDFKTVGRLNIKF